MKMGCIICETPCTFGRMSPSVKTIVNSVLQINCSNIKLVMEISFVKISPFFPHSFATSCFRYFGENARLLYELSASYQSQLK